MGGLLDGCEVVACGERYVNNIVLDIRYEDLRLERRVEEANGNAIQLIAMLDAEIGQSGTAVVDGVAVLVVTPRSSN